MTDIQIKMAAYLYLTGILVDLIWEILKIIDSKKYLKRVANKVCEEYTLTERTVKVIIIITAVVLVPLYCGAWPFSMHLDIWKKKNKKTEVE